MYYIYLLGTPTIKDGRSPKFGCLYFCQKMQAYCRAQVRKVRVEPKPYTVCFTSSCSRNRAAVSLFWDLLSPQRLLCDPKTGRKFPLGQKHSEIGFTVSQTGDFQKEEFQDLVNLAQYIGC